MSVHTYWTILTDIVYCVIASVEEKLKIYQNAQVSVSL